ncbi:hypothetical protein [Bacillus bombysepticus]|uniref:hypothetical protein n=1 Tax=Bacillus bombysepticus TaxID=658666 RepID=UPI00301A64DF
MKIENKQLLQVELFRIKGVWYDKNLAEWERLYHHYSSHLSCPPSQRRINGNLIAYSPSISYHITSIHFLLDFLDTVCDGRKFHASLQPNKLFLYQQLEEYPQPIEYPWEEYVQDIVSYSSAFRHPVHIFFLPVHHNENLATRVTASNNILVLFSNSTKKDLIYGLAFIYLEKYLRQLPPRFKNKEQFAEAFANGTYRV